MDYSKLDTVFDPLNDVTQPITIIGCGALGSNLAVMLARIGIPEITLYDFDTVEPHNLTNQAYRTIDIGMPKTEALTDILKEINPDIIVHQRKKYIHQVLEGYVFLCLDNVDTRNLIVSNNENNTNIKLMFDLRMGLYDAQAYAYEWTTKGIEQLKQSMDFTHEEAQQNVPMSPCGTTLSVISTVQTIVSTVVINFIKFVRNKGFNNITVIDLYNSSIMSM